MRTEYVEYLNQLKEERDLTLQEISDLSDVPLGTVKRMFSGQAENPGIESIVEIVRAMGGSMDVLTGIQMANMQRQVRDHMSDIDRIMHKQLKDKDKWIWIMFCYCVFCTLAMVAFAVMVGIVQ